MLEKAKPNQGPDRVAEKSPMDRAFAAAMKAPSRPKRWRVLPAEGSGECDYDPETSKAFEDETEKVARRGAALWQEAEALRLAEDYALRRPGTTRREITGSRLEAVIRVSAAWGRLAADLRKIRRGF